MNEQYNLIDAIKVVLNHFKLIATAVVVASIASIVVALFVLPVKYKSEAIIYPSNPLAHSRSALFNLTGDAIIDPFGTKSDANRLLTIGKSGEVLGYLTNRFRLWDRYEIDTSEVDWRTNLALEFEDHYEIKKTERDAIQLTIYDKDPDTAAAMVAVLLEQIDQFNQNAMRQNADWTISMLAEKKHQKQLEVNFLTDSLEQISNRYNIKRMGGSKGESVLVGDNEKGKIRYAVFENRQKYSMQEYNELMNLYEQHRAANTPNLSSIVIFEKPQPIYKKAKPIRWLVVVSTVMVVGFLSVIGVLLLDQYKRISAQLKQ